MNPMEMEGAKVAAEPRVGKGGPAPRAEAVEKAAVVEKGAWEALEGRVA
jgi:hypothetical protein